MFHHLASPHIEDLVWVDFFSCSGQDQWAGLARVVEVKRSRWVGLMWEVEIRSFLSVTAGRSFSLQRREGERVGPSLLHQKETRANLFIRGRTEPGISLCMVYPLMSWCVSGSGWIFCSERFVHPRIQTVSPLYTPFSSRWDEFGQNRRGSEGAAGPRRGPRVSFTESFEQQPRNFRELKQRVFRHRVGRYTVTATLFFLLSAMSVSYVFVSLVWMRAVADACGGWILGVAHVSVFAYSPCIHRSFPRVALQNAQE